VNATTIFDPVDLSRHDNVQVWAVVRIADTGYEREDLLDVYVTNDTERVYLIYADGDSGLDSYGGDVYRTFGAVAPSSWSQARLVFKSTSNSGAGSESYDICAVEFLSVGDGSPCGDSSSEVEFLRGDANVDGDINLSDGIRILGFLFLGGGDLECYDAADTNDTGSIDITDGIGLFNFLFLGGPPPPSPGNQVCGPDASEDLFECESYPPCS
jgi:hypothetical protein